MEKQKETVGKSNHKNNNCNMLIIKKQGTRPEFDQESPLLKTSNKRQPLAQQSENKMNNPADSEQASSDEDCNILDNETGSNPNASQVSNKLSSSKKSLRYEKNLLITKLNTRIHKLHKHKEAGDLQFEK